MAKIKSPLLMADGARVRTIEELREHFDMASILACYDSGKLQKWLENYYYDAEAAEIGKLDPASLDIKERICGILGVSYTGGEAGNMSLTNISDRNKRLEKLKRFTSDDEILKAVDCVAFTQKELQDLLAAGVKKIYLCQEQEKFEIPGAEGVTYVGVNHPSASVSEWFGEKKIVLQNVDIGVEGLLRSAEEYSVKQDYAEAVKLWRKAAEQGHAGAQRMVGECFLFGIGVVKDEREANKWYREAAEQGDARAQGIVGENYYYGKNYIEAYKWCKRAAEQGDAGAQYIVGKCYEEGRVVEQDKEEADKWYKKAAERGDVLAKIKVIASARKEKT